MKLIEEEIKETKIVEIFQIFQDMSKIIENDILPKLTLLYNTWPFVEGVGVIYDSLLKTVVDIYQKYFEKFHYVMHVFKLCNSNYKSFRKSLKEVLILFIINFLLFLLLFIYFLFINYLFIILLFLFLFIFLFINLLF